MTIQQEIGFAKHLPTQLHRKAAKKGFDFNLMVVGESGLGKSTLVNSLFMADLYPDRRIPDALDMGNGNTVEVEANTVEIDEHGVKVRLTVIDTPGYGDRLNNENSFEPIIKYINDQYNSYLCKESGINRKNIVDTRVHCVLYFISSLGRGLKPLDVAFMKALQDKVNIIPLVAKADSLTAKECEALKETIRQKIADHGIQIYDLMPVDDDPSLEDPEYVKEISSLRASFPLAVCAAQDVQEVNGRQIRARRYPWGSVEVDNEVHCDFQKLKTIIIHHLEDMIERTETMHYENYRVQCLMNKGLRQPDKEILVLPSDDILQKERELQATEKKLREMEKQIENMKFEMAKQASRSNLDSASIITASSVEEKE
ncbi:septin-2 [Galendromus occidentalis]|uniref:Septin n=1 Tax=Galendromus occidentalis TaxID=34638 RepID=A0AAJ6QYX1_9ACAR|nr:septin-2 [Galendromus occidentalis]